MTINSFAKWFRNLICFTI